VFVLRFPKSQFIPSSLAFPSKIPRKKIETQKATRNQKIDKVCTDLNWSVDVRVVSWLFSHLARGHGVVACTKSRILFPSHSCLPLIFHLFVPSFEPHRRERVVTITYPSVRDQFAVGSMVFAPFSDFARVVADGCTMDLPAANGNEKRRIEIAAR